ncbi:MAG TPA: alpha-ketoglutarate-dependent dioxygenase AlkB [Steroidobacteraceae bacterium]|nr:alpha-ketoglutarate-dependent dioxygenase AlkB [Steroidobacteraceae bacterium]
MSVSTGGGQHGLFDLAPAGFVHGPDFISGTEEAELLAHAQALPFKPFAFHGWLGKRETVSFGWRYDFNDATMHAAPPIPEFLLPLRERAAIFARLPPDNLEQASVIRYDAGAGIGWHRDRPVFDKVVGVSLLTPCILRFRRREARGFARFAFDAQPRSAYLLSGEIRHDWEHSIAPMKALRFSITFRSRSCS